MGVRTLIGEYDGTQPAGCMVDSGSGFTMGPIFEGYDAAEQIDAFLEWLRSHRWLHHLPEIFTPADHMAGLAPRFKSTLLDGDSPYGWTDQGLERLINYWRPIHVEDRELLDVKACVCGHDEESHVAEGEDGGPGCYICDPGDGRCMEWRPGNRAAELRVADEKGTR